MDIRKKSILIVDDEEDLTWSISRYLQKNDALFDVTCVDSGDKALGLFDNNPVDLVISDVRMPGISGLELHEILSEKYPSTKIIIMTAFGSELLEEQISRPGMTYYIEKPFELVVLREIVYSALEISEKKIEKSLINSRIKEIIAFNCQSGITSQIKLHRGLHQGIIYFKQGEIIHAECGELEGEHALFNILDWGKVDSYSRLENTVTKRTIRRTWQSLLNNSMID